MLFDAAMDIIKNTKRSEKKSVPKDSSQELMIDGYNTEIDEIRSREYAHLKGQVYLDNAGLPVCAKSVIENSNEVLLQNVYGNPHSQSAVSQITENLIGKARLDVLKLFNLDYMTHEVVFTQNATHAIKLLGEAFKDTFDDFHFSYNTNSHTSIIGIREQASEFSTFDNVGSFMSSETNQSTPTLIAWAGQSNFNGKRFPIEEWNATFKKRSPNTFTLLDASSLCSTSPPDLGSMKSIPDFVCVSLYKIFGYPNLGCLILNKNSGEKVFAGKKYFSGGTVDAVTTDGYVQRKTNLSSKLEEGTLPIYSIIQLSAAIATFEQIYGSFNKITKHVRSLTRYAIDKFNALHHDNDEKMIELFTCSDESLQGPIISFCLLDRTGKRLGYYDFEKYVSARKISLRTGALCNYGATCEALQLDMDDVAGAYERGHRCGDGQDSFNGKVNGVIRVSFGAMSNIADVDHLCSCIIDYFSEDFFTGFSNIKHSELTVKSLCIYPIKSCAAFSIAANQPWAIKEGGLEYDRMFCLLDPSTLSPLLLKNHPQMTFIRPKIDPLKKIMSLSYKAETVEISLADNWSTSHSIALLAGPKNETLFECVTDANIRGFFEKVLSVPCLLAKPMTQSLHNKSDFLVLSNSSLRYLEYYDKDQAGKESSSRFRGNIVVQGKDLKPFEEDNWNYIKINELVLKNTELCERCHMITIDAETGKRDNKAFVNLSKFRKLGGKILFGINCDIDEDCKSQMGKISLAVGDKITIS